MLIEFSVTNFRSFRSRQTLSMAASAATELARENTFRTGIANLPSLVRSAAIYGPNAAGKTNLVRAALVMQQGVLTSAVAGQVGQKLNFQPFAFSSETRDAPSEFEVHFIQDKIRYQYGFAATNTHVVREWLIAYPSGRPQRWFERSHSVKSGKTRWTFGSKLRGQRNVWRDATRPNALFLSTAVQLNNMQLKPIFDWFQQQLVIVLPGIELNPYLTYELFATPEGKSAVLRFLSAADLRISDIEVTREPFNLTPQGAQTLQTRRPIKVIETAPGKLEAFSVKAFHAGTDGKAFIQLDMADESNGTQNLFNQVGGYLKVLSTGAVAFIDEIERSLHPKIVRFLVETFQDPEVNKRNAQLVFTTHDTSILSNQLLRRDQIWFADRPKGQTTELYSMADFGRRKDEAFEKNYLRGRYGALPIVGEFSLNG